MNIIAWVQRCLNVINSYLKVSQCIFIYSVIDWYHHILKLTRILTLQTITQCDHVSDLIFLLETEVLCIQTSLMYRESGMTAFKSSSMPQNC